jgi:ubiquinone/menaquinone biosynthesis C-methylase UbiE
MAARRWARYNESPHHLSAFGAGLDHCTRPGTVLDVGTGTGDAAAMVADRHPEASVVAVDTSRRMLAIARDRHRGANVTFRRCSVARLPFGDESFDLVTCVNAVPDPIEIRRVLRTGGAVLAAATTKTLGDDASDWVARWRAVGFRREAGADVDGGSWERYVREDGT